MQGIALKLRRKKMSLPSRLSGQALILALITLVVLVVGVIVLFNSGQAVSKKMQLVNTADAAAYSAAVQQARALNMISYMNRATVANQVAMAQMVSWYSWTNFAISATDHLKDAIQTVAIVADISVVGAELGAVLQQAANILGNVKDALVQGRDLEQEVLNIASAVIANLDGAYSKASHLIASPVQSADIANLARRIARLNNPRADIPAMGLALLAQSARSANGYVARYMIPTDGSQSAEADRLANVVMEARDPFSRVRNGHVGFGAGSGLASIGLSMDKKGGTDLVHYRNWVGVDTLNLHVWFPLCWSGGWFSHPETCHVYVPMAWGGAAGVDKEPSNGFSGLARQDNGWNGPYTGRPQEYAGPGSYPAYGGALQNGSAGNLVLSDPAGNGTPWIKPSLSVIPGATVGLPDYNDIKSDKATVPYLNGKSASANGVNNLDVGPLFTVLVEESMNSVRTSSHVPGIGGPPDFDIADKTVHDKMTALSSAQVYFSRSQTLFPNLVDSHRETGSLFSPYWQVRLVETPCTTQLAVAATYGVVGVCSP